jgi:hypothetical protein
MFSIETGAYHDMLKIHDQTKTPLYVYGAPGIGKSAIPRQVFQAIAKSEGRNFMEWNDMTEQDKDDAMAKPEDFFVFTDFRLGQCDTTDLRGIPNMTKADVLEYMPLAWVKYYASEGARGVIFFDELNLAPPVVAGQAYQIINDRVVSDIRLSDDVFIFGAGNRASDKAHVFTMPFPLRDRFSEVEVGVNDEEWCNWAWKNKVNPHLIAFIKWKPTALYRPASGTEDKGSTPRGVVRASNLIEKCGLPIEHPTVHALTSCALGEAFATEFGAYTAIASKIDLDALMKKPKSVKDFQSPDKWFAVCGLLGENLRKLKPTDPKSAKMFEIAHELPTEYSVVALNMIRTSFDSNPKFKNALSKYPRFKELLEEAARYALA